jgi:hypothetical protein
MSAIAQEAANALRARRTPPIARNALDLLTAPVVQARTTRARDHRPWPMPPRPWVMGQTWLELLFAHWSVAPADLTACVPPQLPLDTFDGRAWIGVTPFADQQE